MRIDSFFPQGQQLKSLLNLHNHAELDQFFSRSLTEPLQEMFSRPKKNLRAKLVELGFQIASSELKKNESQNFYNLLGPAQVILEILHAGSLIIDDIEDGTAVRRGQAALHVRYGIPLALNAGNWLYFLPFQKIEQMNLKPDKKMDLFRECQKTLLRAHYGQALDIGIPVDSIPQSQVSSVSIATMELKSGVLAGFALKIGAIVAGCPEASKERLELWGRRFGIALQMFDDVGNLKSQDNPEKRGEDLRLKRPSFLFAVAAENLKSDEYQNFLEILNQESTEKSIDYLQRHSIDKLAHLRAEAELLEANKIFEELFNLSTKETDLINTITQKLVSSYA